MDSKGNLGQTDLEVFDTILEQLGGLGAIRAMLGATQIRTIAAGARIRWPNPRRSLGNQVDIVLERATDTYFVSFRNVTARLDKPVKSYSGVYADQLIDIFERQTGYTLRVPKFVSRERLG